MIPEPTGWGSRAYNLSLCLLTNLSSISVFLSTMLLQSLLFVSAHLTPEIRKQDASWIWGWNRIMGSVHLPLPGDATQHVLLCYFTLHTFKEALAQNVTHQLISCFIVASSRVSFQGRCHD